jgi:zinc D-Ala-D-Ala carboxypeptidase
MFWSPVRSERGLVRGPRFALPRRPFGRAAHARQSRRRLGGVVVGTVMSLGLLASPVRGAGSQAVARSTGVPPACSYADRTTRLSQTSQWRTTVLDSTLRLPSNYVPPLVPVGRAGFGGSFLVRPEVIADLSAMRRAAVADGDPLAIASAYRSYGVQVSTFDGWAREYGNAAALLASARPGHSEHQLGTAIDFTTAGGRAPWSYDDWAKTGAGAWMAANAMRFGFVLSYPNGAVRSTSYQYEPWHYRYFGRKIAAEMAKSGLTTRDYLWAHGGGGG